MLQFRLENSFTFRIKTWYLIMASGRSGKPWCPCGKTQLADLTPAARMRWAEAEGVSWSMYSERQAYFRFCQSCHMKYFPNDLRPVVGNRYSQPGTSLWQSACEKSCIKCASVHVSSHPGTACANATYLDPSATCGAHEHLTSSKNYSWHRSTYKNTRSRHTLDAN